MFRRKQKDQSAEEPIAVVSGATGTVWLFSNRVELQHKGYDAFLFKSSGKKTLYFHQIAGIQLRKPRLTSGSLRIMMNFDAPTRGIHFTGDDHTILLGTRKHYEQAQTLKEALDRMLSNPSPTPVET